jgi:hypothetical protein
MKSVPEPIDCNGLNDVDKSRIAEIGLWVWMDEQVALSPDYHVAHSCVRKPVQNERHPFPTAFGSSPSKAG